MASNKQRGEKIMVFGTDQFLDYPIESKSEAELKQSAEKFILGDTIQPVYANASLCGPNCYMTAEEFQEGVLGIAVADSLNIKFTFACFIYFALGGEEI